MGRRGENVLADAVNAFFGTYLALDQRKTDREDAEQERRYKEFYMKLQGNADARAAESHAASMEEWDVKQAELLREAEARQQFLEANGQSFEAWSMMNPVEQFKMQQATHEMAQEINALQLETGRFNLQQNKALAPLELEGARLRNRATAMGGSGRAGGKPVDELSAIQEKWEEYSLRQKSIEARLKMYENPVTGETDWARVPEPLMQSYQMNSQHMSELEQGLAAGNGAALGLSAFGGPGSSEGPGGAAAPVGAIDAALAGKRGPVVSEEEQRAREAARARQSNVKTRKVAVVGPDGTLVATDDDAVFQRKVAEGGEWWDMKDVPGWAIGKPAAQWKRYREEQEKQGVLGGYRGMGGMPSSTNFGN